MVPSHVVWSFDRKIPVRCGVFIGKHRAAKLCGQALFVYIRLCFVYKASVVHWLIHMGKRLGAVILAVLLIAGTQTGCSAVVAGLAVATGAVVAMQERSVGDVIDDASILMGINRELFKHGIFSAVTVKVSEGRVLLVGSVDAPEKRLQAEKVAWQQRDVKEVANEIVVNLDATTLKSYAADSAISAQVRARMVARAGVKSMNYSVNTVGGVVYLMGIAQSQKELNAVVAIAKRVRGVKQVISYVRLKYSRLRH
ncbi:BON domain protein [Anaplasma phagocytophilum str. ApMUC09]|uniref:BON domain protein n=1 Tax=Anaplasma phagocytophilum str. ApMUC09 TaxID=1359152 RepID=A0A0F3NAK5_ANAPH|nr:BON domain protein [Anaplasma phagocytophilum str. ApMUC09]SCV62595.1 Osmotically-inducible protein Y precursor [Anaplasma phagocytophilum]